MDTQTGDDVHLFYLWVYTCFMDMTVTQFRRDLFQVVDQAMNGTEVHVTYKGRGFTLKPDTPPKNRLDRITPMNLLRGSLDGANEQLMGEMQQAWEQDWAEL